MNLQSTLIPPTRSVQVYSYTYFEFVVFDCSTYAEDSEMKICFNCSFIESVLRVCRCGGNRSGLLQLPASHPLLWTHQLRPHHQPRGPLCHPSPSTRHCSCKYFQNKLRSSCILYHKSSQNPFRLIIIQLIFVPCYDVGSLPKERWSSCLA